MDVSKIEDVLAEDGGILLNFKNKVDYSGPFLFSKLFCGAPPSCCDDVLAEDGGLLHVLPLTVHLNFFYGQVGWTILDHSYFLNFFVGPLLHA